ncbi:glycoside hydrolase family 16 protein [Stipitochalara longipes BDJ]|nr:glycoside hydrolase family 16 protein [Stipitochalara longipes BDJ]
MKSSLPLLIAAAASIANAKTLYSRLHLRQTPSNPSLIKSNFTSIFLDNFSGSAGTLPSSTNWLFDLGTSYPGGPAQWGNSESEKYTNSITNIQITNQNTLTITPRLSHGVWTSARIETVRSDFAANAGGQLYIESRIKLGNAPATKQQGIWPAFWALGSKFRGNYANWPAVSEWDLLEAINGGSTMYSTVHCGVAPGGPCNEYNGIGSGGVPFSRGAWHTVGFLVDRSMCGNGSKSTWADETLNWYLDGSKVFTISGKRVGDEKTWGALAHDEHFLLLNVAVGGSWPGGPNSQTVDGLSVGMEIDYVEVWKSP